MWSSTLVFPCIVWPIKYSAKYSHVKNIILREGFKFYCASKQHRLKFGSQKHGKKYEQALTTFVGCIRIDDKTFVKIDHKQLSGPKYNLATNFGDFLQIKVRFCWQIRKATYDLARYLPLWLKTKVYITSSTMILKIYIEQYL